MRFDACICGPRDLRGSCPCTLMHAFVAHVTATGEEEYARVLGRVCGGCLLLGGGVATHPRETTD
jgi:hypothetical protein